MLTAGTSLGPYRILGAIGAGGMGEVYRARDTRLERDVALKVIPSEVAGDPERIKRFEQEARAAGALSHPNVCAIYDVGTHEGSPFVVMELLQGVTLLEKLGAGPIPVRKALEYAAQAAHGLAAAHEKGIVHRDLKPANLFLTKDGRVKVLDFGLAKLTRPDVVAPGGETARSIAGTETGAVLGTVGYMSPEQVRGDPVDGRSDLFSLGVILYELLTGKRAFHGATYVETLHAILNADPVPLSATGSGRAFPPALELMVRRCLEKSPEQRFQSARDLAFDLENVSGSAVGAPVVTTPGAARARRRRLIGLVAGACLVTAILGVAGAFALIQAKHLVDPARVRYTRLTVQRGMIWGARFAPDGRTVFYTAAWEGRPWEILETRPGFPTSRTVVAEPAWLQSISKDGTMIAKVRDPGGFGVSCLAEVPMTGGTPRRISENVRFADWAPDGKTLAVIRIVDGKSRIEMPWGHVIYEPSSDVYGLRVSPDGKHLVTREYARSYYARVMIMDSSGRVTARSGEWIVSGYTCWSAGTDEVWFTCSQDQNSSELRALSPHGRERLLARFDGMVYLMDVGPDGQALLARINNLYGILGRKRRLGTVRELGWYDGSVPAALSTDGSQILFGEEGLFGGKNGAVCLRGTDGSSPVRLGTGRAEDLSPDGAWALTLQEGPPQRLVLLPTGVGDTISLPRGALESYLGAWWMPDGKRVHFAASEPGQAPREYIQDIAGGLPRAIVPGLGVAAISPDCRFLALRIGDDLRIRPLDGDSARFVTRILQGEKVLRWSADGRSLFMGKYEGQLGQMATYWVSRLDLATGKRTPWLTSSIPDSAGAATGNFLITSDGQSYAHGYVRSLADLYLAEGLK